MKTSTETDCLQATCGAVRPLRFRLVARWLAGCILSQTLLLVPAFAQTQTPAADDFPSLSKQPFADRFGDTQDAPGRTLPPADEPFPELDDRVRPGGSPTDTMPRDSDLPGELPLPGDFGIDWAVQRVSPADITPVAAWSFLHGQPRMSDAESGAYGEFIRAALNRRNLIPASLPEGMNPTTAWETAFYQFEAIRRQAFEHGVLRLDSAATAVSDPVSGSGVFEGRGPLNVAPADPAANSYTLLDDMRAHPGEFVGRPVVLYGIFSPSGALDVTATSGLEGEDREYRLQRGTLRSLTGREPLAIVDALQFIEPGAVSEPSSAWPVESGVQIPVMVKGWFVKLWGRQPLIFTEVVRVLGPQPYTAWIRQHVPNRRRVSADETWLYYETLRQLQVTSGSLQQQLANARQKRRVDALLAEIRLQAVIERSLLINQLNRGTIERAYIEGQLGYDARMKRLDRQLAVREARYLKSLREPDSFPIFVDIFQNSDRWQGELVTLKGYVRRVMTHPGDPMLFNGQPLHELWLYTRDSQHIPAVVVTPILPREFPKSADLVDSVVVTGCFYRMYVYRAQDETRQAPLVLAGRVDWQPSPQHVLGLVRDGHIRDDSPLAADARAKDPRRVSDTVVLGAAVLVVVIALAVFGRVQRDRRRRQRLLRLVAERPDFRQSTLGFPESLP